MPLLFQSQMLWLAARVARVWGKPRRAYDLIDRLLAVRPGSDAAWLDLINLLEQADVELAYWIGLRGNQAARIDVTVAALRTLINLKCRASWIMQVCSVKQWPRPAVGSFWELVERKLTAQHIGVLADCALELGQKAEAKELLRHAIAVAPSNGALWQRMVELLETQLDLVGAESAAKGWASHMLGSTPARLALARIQSSLGRFENATATLEALSADRPDDPLVWLEYGRVARFSYERAGGGAELFERAGDLASNNGFVLESVANYFLYQLDYARALKYYDRLFALDQHAWKNPVAVRNYARCLRRAGREQEAADAFARSIERWGILAAQSEGEGHEAMVREQARVLMEAGRADESLALLHAVGASAKKIDYARSEYLPHTEARMERLRRIVESRDLLVMLQGPSFADFAARADQIEGCDFAVATLGAFPPVEDAIHKATGRLVDLILLSHPTLLRAWKGEFAEFLSRPAQNMLLTTRYALSSLADFGDSETDFIKKNDERLLFVEPNGGPPLPSRPLHFEDGPSLALILPLLLLGRPRRVFLVGADGGVAADTPKRPYFFYDDIDARDSQESFLNRPDIINFKGQPERLKEANRRWRTDALNSDQIITFTLECLHAVFEVPIPPIINVCPHSTHAIFPKRDVATAVKMIRE